MSPIRLSIVLVGFLAVGCKGSKGNPATPPPPPPPVQTTPTRIIALSGVLEFGGVQVGQSLTRTFEIRNSGNNALAITGMTITTGLAGAYTATWTDGSIAPGASQSVDVRFTPTAEQAYNGTLTINGDQTSGTNTLSISGTGTRPPGPRTTFGAGTYRVGSDVAAGRYFSDPDTGCYWERLSGLGGTFGEIIANEFVSTNVRQWIVDIRATDHAFKTDAQCGNWFKDAPRHGAQSTIQPGVWIVGGQVSSGTYRAQAQSGCYWERLRDFTGTTAGIIANDFVSSPGQQLVTIRSTDAGFNSDADCGEWTRISSVTDVVSVTSDAGMIERNRQMKRQRAGLLTR